MKSLTWLVVSILEDSGIQCSTDVTRDIQRVRDESEHRGESFLTLTLPAFGDAFDECLDRGQVDLTLFPSILGKIYRQGGQRRGIPAFLRGFLGQVFSPLDGVILHDPSIEAIFAVRQICRATKKLRRTCSRKRNERALARFKECDAEIVDAAYRDDRDGSGDFVATASVLWTEIFGDFDRTRSAEKLLPKHGPGATAERISGNGKYRIRQWTRRLQEEFPVDFFAYANAWHLLSEGIDSPLLDLREPKDELPVRVHLVPKTAKTPRVIAIEPVCMQYTQQALSEYLVERLESHWITAGHLNFTDQGINQSVAMRASVTRKAATIDLSEASDRVSASLVSDMLCRHPQLRAAVFACRSSRAQLPDGTIVPLKKFASMGSALCFPIEAMVFYTIIASTLLREHKLRPTAHNINHVMGGVYIYGDDIIVPVDVVATVMADLELYGLKVNTTKSFWNGSFRESCGTDAFNGVSVKPVYIREMLPSDRRSHREIISTVHLANKFYLAGYWRTARRLRELIETLVGDLPHLQSTSPGLGWISSQGYYSCHRWNSELHRFEVKTVCPVPARKKDILDGYHALLKFFLKRGKEPSQDEKHLRETVRSGTVSIRRRWLTPY